MKVKNYFDVKSACCPYKQAVVFCYFCIFQQADKMGMGHGGLLLAEWWLLVPPTLPESRCVLSTLHAPAKWCGLNWNLPSLGSIFFESGVLLFEGVGNIFEEDQTEHNVFVLDGVHIGAERTSAARQGSASKPRFAPLFVFFAMPASQKNHMPLCLDQTVLQRTLRPCAAPACRRCAG